MRSRILFLWLIMHILIIVTNLLSITYILPKNSRIWFSQIGIGLSAGLNCLVAVLELRVTSTIGQPLLIRMYLNFAFHVSTTSLIFLCVKYYPVFWRIALALNSFYQALQFITTHYVAGQTNPGMISRYILYIYHRLNNPPVYSTYIAALEIYTIIPLSFNQSITKIHSLVVVKVFYIFWFLMFRYATNRAHQQLWNTASFYYVSIAGRFPQAISYQMIRLLAMFSNFGTVAEKIYKTQQREINNGEETPLI